jgi:hypothetical protein
MKELLNDDCFETLHTAELSPAEKEEIEQLRAAILDCDREVRAAVPSIVNTSAIDTVHSARLL